MKKEMILVIGANGQLGTEMMMDLRREHGNSECDSCRQIGCNRFRSATRLVLDRSVTQINLLDPMRTKNAQYAVDSSRNFEMNYEPDVRQAIANDWPVSINDPLAQQDWHCRPLQDLRSMTVDALHKLSVTKGIQFDIYPNDEHFCPDYSNNEYAY